MRHRKTDGRYRYWPKADMRCCTAYVRFRSKADVELGKQTAQQANWVGRLLPVAELYCGHARCLDEIQVSLLPSPEAGDAIYQVLDDLGKYGHVWSELAENEANEQTIVEWIIEGQFKVHSS